MIFAFVIMTIAAVIFVLFVYSAWKSETPVGFFANVKPPEIPEKNVKRYNRAVAKLWFVLAIIFEFICLPVIGMEQNSPYAIFLILAIMFWAIGSMVAYLIIQQKYMKK